jgi:hypothetical protein
MPDSGGDRASCRSGFNRVQLPLDDEAACVEVPRARRERLARLRDG